MFFNRIILLAFAHLLFLSCQAQAPGGTANNGVPEFKGRFGYGVNMGYFPPHYYDMELATLARGSSDGKVPGIGVTTIRPALFEHFLEQWGYDIRVDAFKHYKEIGLEDVVVFIGYPAPQHRDSAYYCPGQPSELFRNMYEPIWDGGENGTPVNEKNYYAAYVWKMVSRYGPYVRFWEVWNEPDVDTGNAWAPPGIAGNWWENAPGPCETKLKSPIYYYIRMLRITYEVVKSLEPDDYVCVGGIGWPSYLDAICRYTDNPFDGAESSKYPLKGGAYFDALSYHSYPHIDNSLREWSNEIFNFRYFRHSDRAVDGVWKLKGRFEEVLNKYGYNDKKFPKKECIITEVNVPRKEFGDYLGSNEAQINFTIKALITAQMNGVRQIHIYSLSDEVPEREAGNEFGFMGLFKNLVGVQPYQGEINPAAYAFKTTSDLLRDAEYHPGETEKMRLPANIRGAAFRDKSNQFIYALWAVTNKDRDESAAATYAFPEGFLFQTLEQKYWHYSQTGTKTIVNAKEILLTGSPVFLTPVLVSEKEFPKAPKVSPNPTVRGYGVLSFYMFEEAWATIEVYDAAGRKVQTIAERQTLSRGPHQRLLDWSGLAQGVYQIRVQTPESDLTVQVARQ